MGNGVSGGIKAVGKGNFTLFLKYLEYKTIIHRFLGKDFSGKIEASNHNLGLKHYDRCEWWDTSCQ